MLQFTQKRDIGFGETSRLLAGSRSKEGKHSFSFVKQSLDFNTGQLQFDDEGTLINTPSIIWAFANRNNLAGDYLYPSCSLRVSRRFLFQVQIWISATSGICYNRPQVSRKRVSLCHCRYRRQGNCCWYVLCRSYKSRTFEPFGCLPLSLRQTALKARLEEEERLSHLFLDLKTRMGIA